MLLTMRTAAYPRAPSPRGSTRAWHSCTFTHFTIRLYSRHPILKGETVNPRDVVVIIDAVCTAVGRREFDTGTNRLKGNGGSTAVGHPLRSTGSRVLTDLLNDLGRPGSRDGLLAIRDGGGMANATIIERIS